MENTTFSLKLQIADDVITDVEDGYSPLPTSYSLLQNYPNPFNPSTTIEFSLPERSRVRLTVYNVIGQEIAVLVAEEKGAGVYRVLWNAGALPSGVYFSHLEAKNFMATKKMVLMK